MYIFKHGPFGVLGPSALIRVEEELEKKSDDARVELGVQGTER